jgi:hypothetical protein
MKLKVNNIRLQYTEQGNAEVVLSTTNRHLDIAKEKEIIGKGKELAVDIKQHRNKRSLDANAYLWVVLSLMADALHTSKDELYLQVLERYGVFTHIVVKPNVVDKVKREWRTVRELGEVTINGKTGVQLQCYFGSSTYDSKEFSVLLNGVLSEAADMGIETIGEVEKQSLLDEWGK